ncbi:hypothetical protein OERS_39360 [Oerskovia enterophila]|uniref:Uncharacterized protein n=1 Tax=Oerskovia enterophila TaxID=43678 RepID=A0ABX2XYK6_9CELL|nr:hypothetical protein OERS_39360 [Oerskovia enterophila]
MGRRRGWRARAPSPWEPPRCRPRPGASRVTRRSRSQGPRCGPRTRPWPRRRSGARRGASGRRARARAARGSRSRARRGRPARRPAARPASGRGRGTPRPSALARQPCGRWASGPRDGSSSSPAGCSPAWTCRQNVAGLEPGGLLTTRPARTCRQNVAGPEPGGLLTTHRRRAGPWRHRRPTRRARGHAWRHGGRGPSEERAVPLVSRGCRAARQPRVPRRTGPSVKSSVTSAVTARAAKPRP